MALRRVDLPEPTCPTTPINEPLFMCNLSILREMTSTGAGSCSESDLSISDYLRDESDVMTESLSDFGFFSFLLSFLPPFFFESFDVSFLPSSLCFFVSLVYHLN